VFLFFSLCFLLTMQEVIVISIAVAILFFVAKIVEMKFVLKDMRPLKFLIQETALVFVCSLISTFGFFQFNRQFKDLMSIVTDTKEMDLTTTEIFTDDPGF